MTAFVLAERFACSELTMEVSNGLIRIRCRIKNDPSGWEAKGFVPDFAMRVTIANCMGI